MNTLSLDLPLPPSLNNAYWNATGRGRIATEELRRFKDAAIPLATHLAREADFTVPAKARLRVSLAFSFGTRRSHSTSDIDNRVKPALDALSKALCFNDNRVDELIVRRAPYDGHERATALVEILEVS